MIEISLPLAPELFALVPAPDHASLLEQLATLRLENAALRTQNAVLPACIREPEARLGRLLQRGQENPGRKAAALCRELRKWWVALWTFARGDGVEPTNNVAEHALRPAVLWRKGSFGADSETGSRFAERLLTVVATCRQQGRPLLDFLVAANEAALWCSQSPSLLAAPHGG
jgi:hypothetical protein